MMSKSCHGGWENRCLNKKLKSVKTSSSSSSSFFFCSSLFNTLLFFSLRSYLPSLRSTLSILANYQLLSHVAALGYNLNDI